jgi:hypothetical protein
MTVGDWISAGATIVQTTAILVGAAWAYFKFVRGRTFAHRTELGVKGELLTSEARSAIRAQVTLRNTGASDIPLRVAVVYVYAVGPSDWRHGSSPSWQKVGVAKVLANHAAIEAQESISEEALVPLPDQAAEEPLAYRLELQVYDQRKAGGATQWSSQSIVPGALRPVTESQNPS